MPEWHKQLLTYLYILSTYYEITIILLYRLQNLEPEPPELVLQGSVWVWTSIKLFVLQLAGTCHSVEHSFWQYYLLQGNGIKYTLPCSIMTHAYQPSVATWTAEQLLEDLGPQCKWKKNSISINHVTYSEIECALIMSTHLTPQLPSQLPNLSLPVSKLTKAKSSSPKRWIHSISRNCFVSTTWDSQWYNTPAGIRVAEFSITLHKTRGPSPKKQTSLWLSGKK